MSEELKAALARIACLEGEIAKRDEELSACRAAVENCEVFRARIAELEARIVWLECEAQVNAAPVSEAKAQDEYGDAYQGAREDLAIWKRRALEAEKALQEERIITERLGNALNEENGPTFMGEPVFPAKAQGVVMPPSPYMPGVESAQLSDYERGEAQGRCDMWAEVARLNADPVQQVSAPMEADTVDAPWMSADTEPEIAWRDGFNACRARWLAATPAPAQQATDGGRNPRYEGLFEGETEEQRALRLAPVRQDSAKPAGWLDPDMALPCDVKLPGGMQISKGCKLSTLLISFRNRCDDVPWRQRFSVPAPYDPTLANIILELTAVDHLQTGIDSEAKP